MAATYGSHDACVCARMFAARSLAFVGRVEEAIRMSDEAIDHAHFLGHPFSTALALKFRAALDQSREEVAGAAEHAAKGGAIARDQGFGLMSSWCSTIAGWAAVGQGDHSAGLDAMVQGIATARRSGSDQFQPYLHGMLAHACLTAGRIEQGVTAVNEGLALAERTGERFYEAELHRLHGELIVASGGDAVDAQAAFRKAIEVARSQGAAMLVLRAAIRLGRLPSSADETAAGRELLRAARNAVPPGEGLPDTDEADALLLQ
jgi:predicted ATPase